MSVTYYCCRCFYFYFHFYRCRSKWRDRLVAPGLTTQHRSDFGSYAASQPQCSEEDLEPVYATISEITDNMDENSLSPVNLELFHTGLVQVFADLAALPADTERCSTPGQVTSWMSDYVFTALPAVPADTVVDNQSCSTPGPVTTWIGDHSSLSSESPPALTDVLPSPRRGTLVPQPIPGLPTDDRRRPSRYFHTYC